jgi:hypothetical protein
VPAARAAGGNGEVLVQHGEGISLVLTPIRLFVGAS